MSATATPAATFAQAETLGSLKLANPEFTFRPDVFVDERDGLVVLAYAVRADELVMEWVIFDDGVECHLSTRYPYGSANWEPHPDDLT
jgi:hypothetical protein